MIRLQERSLKTGYIEKKSTEQLLLTGTLLCKGQSSLICGPYGWGM